MLALSLPVPCQKDGEELEAALGRLRAAKRADILGWLQEHPEALARTVAALRRLNPEGLTIEDLRDPVETLPPDRLTVRQAGERWLAWLPTGVSRRGRTFAEGTISTYTNIWGEWLGWEGVADLPVADIKASTLTAWRRWLTESEGWSTANANRYVMAVQGWASWLRDPEHGLGLEDLPPLRVRQLNEGERVPRALLPSETDALRAALSPEHWLLVFDVLLGTGLRVNELLGITAGEIAPGGAAITLRESEGRRFKTLGSARTVPVPRALRAKLEARRKAAPKALTPILDDGLGNQWGFRQAWDRATAKAGIEARPHDLRHTRAVRWIVEDKHDLATVRDYLGHASLSTTDRYTRAVSDYRLRTGKAKK